MIDLSKVSSKVLIGIALLIFALLTFAMGLSYKSNSPFLFYDKAFGFGSEELKKRTAELEDSIKTLSEAVGELKAVRAENLELKEANAKLIAAQQERAQADAATWFPVDDIEFLQEGGYSAQGGKQGVEKWSSRESELKLELIALESTGVVLGTNLQAPENKIRIQTSQSVQIFMDKWDYRVTVLNAYPSLGKAGIRVERRNKHQS